MKMPHFPEPDPAQKQALAFRLTAASNDKQSEEQARIKIKNRRKRYLDLHPEYFKRDELELSDPLLYDRLVRRFLSPQEREKEGRERGYTGILEADLVRSEAKLSALNNPDPNSPMAYRRAANGSIVAAEAEDDRVKDKDEGWRIWIDHQTQKFLRGGDEAFEYEAVDENEEFDDREEEDRSRLERYFEQEDAQYIGDGTPKGETGVQDF